MERAGGEDPGRGSTSMGKVAFASFIGTAIEFYDFYIYGTAAALVFGGGLGPTIASQLLLLTGVSWSISLYMLLMAAVGFAGVFFLSETYLSDLSEMRAGERRSGCGSGRGSRGEEGAVTAE